jgi:HrpA-like RNA helicase
VLAFLPGVGEIRRTGEELAGYAQKNALALCELYGDLPSEQQDQVCGAARGARSCWRRTWPRPR